MTNSIITVVRDPKHTLGKEFVIGPDGTIGKRSSVSVSLGIAVMHRVDTHDQLASLLQEVGADPHVAIINASFNGMEVGETFILLSEREIEARLNIPRGERLRQKGLHEINYDGTRYKAMGRFKENVVPSCWQYFDRDIDGHTPERLATQSFDAWLSSVDDMVPGMRNISYCHAASTSSRVCRNGVPVGEGNGHLWIKVGNPHDVERFRTAMMLSAAQAGLTWKKPRYSRSDPSKEIGGSLTTIVDTSVWTPGRLVFVGKPVVSGELTVGNLCPRVFNGTSDSLNTEAVILPDAKSASALTRKAGVEMSINGDRGSLKVSASDLSLATEIETEDGGVRTVQEILKSGIRTKMRCQTPFRDSSSFAAFLGYGADGSPFVHDTGTSITHWMDDKNSKEYRLALAIGAVARVEVEVKNDCGAPFEPDSVAALKVIQELDGAEFSRTRARLKKANKDVSITSLDTAIKSATKDEGAAQTHHGYASDLIARFTVDDYSPVGFQGSLYVVDAATSLWVEKSVERVTKLAARVHDGKDNCERSSDYNGIAQHAITLATNDSFFRSVPIGLACPGGFYQLDGDKIDVCPLTPAHRQRVMIDVTPAPKETQLFNAFLHQTFKSDFPDEEAQQVRLVQEIAGAIMLGLMARHQKAVQFYDPFGRAGKGTLERILRNLVPPSFVTAVSPFVWDREYYLASLVGSRLNVVGELPDGDAIPAAAFKTVTGGDLLTGRHPTRRPISFKNEAAHLFMSNHLITTKDHSEAFFSRWILVEFPNSRLRTGLPLDAGLPERIIGSEMDGIAHWALLGASRLMRQGKFSSSIVHDRLLAQWRRSTNSMEEFIHESCDLGKGYVIRRSHLYQEYLRWCQQSTRRGFSKGKVKDLLGNNFALGVSLTVLDGIEIFRGIRIKEAVTLEADDDFHKVLAPRTAY